MSTYKEAGVDIELGDDVSKIFYNAAKATWANRKGRIGEVIVPFDDFAGIRCIDISNLKNCVMNINFDGIGTKMEIAERINVHDTIAYDLFAMVCDDAPIRGGEPVLVGSIFDVASLNDRNGNPHLEKVRQLANGYIGAAKAANVAVVNGEVAELGSRVGGYGGQNFINQLVIQWISNNLNPHNLNCVKNLANYVTLPNTEKYKEQREQARDFAQLDENVEKLLNQIDAYSSFNYNWGAACVWFGNKDRLFTGKDIKKGDILVGLHEDGFRSNGLSLARKILENNFGSEWHLEKSYAEDILIPSKIYSAAIVEMFGGYDQEPQAHIKAFSHITGGGIPGKLGRVLKPSDLGACIDEPLEPCALMLELQMLGDVSDLEAYRTWNMGHGGIVITDDPENVIDVASKHEIHARKIGKVTDDKKIVIGNMGNVKKEPALEFTLT